MVKTGNSRLNNNIMKKGFFMMQTRLSSRCTRFMYVAVPVLLLVFAALCVGQDANQNPTAAANVADANAGAVSQVPTEANQTAPAAVPAESATVVTAGTAVVMPGKAEPNAAEDKMAVLSLLEQRLRKTVSVEFKETPIADVVRQLGAQADVDIILSPKVIGNVTATLTDVPLDEALNNILAVQGATYVVGKNMIRVVPIGDVTMEQAKMVTKVYRIYYADIKDVAASLEKFISKNGQISFAVGTSNIIITDTEDKIKSIDDFIKEIDRVTPQILVEARLYDITSEDSLDLGVQWSVGTNTDYGGRGVGGIDKTGKINPFMTGDVGSVQSQKSNITGDSFRFGWLDGSQSIDAIISAKQRDISAKLLANPRVMVIDNKEATIKIISEIPYQELSQTSGGGNIGTTQFKEVGVELKVTPHVTADGLIRMYIKPSFSTRGKEEVVVTTDDAGQQRANRVPGIDKRETETTALVMDGQTVVLGGLRKKETATDLNKVPLLGDLPLVGFLFRFQGDQIMNSELVVFVTPHVVVNPKMSAREQENLKETDFAPPLANEQKNLNKLKKN
jgi:type IV pilus assembly protein PilQ